MDILDEELLKFWNSLNDNNVRYIMVGGFAVNMHGYTRATDDIYVWIEDSLHNRRNLGKALENLVMVQSNGKKYNLYRGGLTFTLGQVLCWIL